MRNPRYTESQIAAILKEYEASGKTAEICRRDGIHANTLRNWKAKYGGMSVSDIARLKQLEDENRRLKIKVAELSLDNDALRFVNAKKLVKPSQRHFVAKAIEEWFGISQRRACRLVQLDRKTPRYISHRQSDESLAVIYQL